MKASDFNIGKTYAAQELDTIEPGTANKTVGKVLIFTVLDPSPIAEFLKVKNSEGDVHMLHPETLARAEPVDNLTF